MTTLTIATSAYGKVILLGEHAVVYGQPALCGALRDGAQVQAVPGEGALVIPAWGKRTQAVYKDQDGSRDTLGLAFGAILLSLGASDRVLDHDFVATFAIPTGAGLGSSAALSVALARAVDQALMLRRGEPAMASAAFLAEQVFHGTPSGLDHTVAQHGGFGLFRRQRGLETVHASAVPLCIGMTGRARDTRGRVERVAELYRERPEEVGQLFHQIGTLVRDGARAVAEGDLVALGRAMNRNQEVLSGLEVSCPEIETLCRAALAAGALGAKLTGGGGGGCVIALAPDRANQVQEAWRAAGFASFVTTVGGGMARGARGTSLAEDRGTRGTSLA